MLRNKPTLVFQIDPAGGAPAPAPTPAPPAPTPEGKTYTQTELDRMFASRADQAQRALLTEWGFESKEQAAQMFAEMRAAADREKKRKTEELTETDRLKAEAEDLAAQNRKLQEQVDAVKALKALKATALRLQIYFVNDEAAEDALSRLKPSALKTDEQWDTAVKELSVVRPYFFTSANPAVPPLGGHEGGSDLTPEARRTAERKSMASGANYSRY